MGQIKTIRKQPFGRTGRMSTVATIFGGASLGTVSQAEADRILDLLLEYGVNHIDTATSYGDAELRIGPWMARHPGIFLNTVGDIELLPLVLDAAARSEYLPEDGDMEDLVKKCRMSKLFV